MGWFDSLIGSLKKEPAKMESGGAPGVVCTKCDPPRKAVSYRFHSGPSPAYEYVCECCGFTWSNGVGRDARGIVYAQTPRGWVRK